MWRTSCPSPLCGRIGPVPTGRVHRVCWLACLFSPFHHPDFCFYSHVNAMQDTTWPPSRRSALMPLTLHEGLLLWVLHCGRSIGSCTVLNACCLGSCTLTLYAFNLVCRPAALGPVLLWLLHYNGLGPAPPKRQLRLPRLHISMPCGSGRRIS